MPYFIFAESSKTNQNKLHSTHQQQATNTIKAYLLTSYHSHVYWQILLKRVQYCHSFLFLLQEEYTEKKKTSTLKHAYGGI